MLSSQKPDTVILIGPNHREIGGFGVITGKYSWETAYGVVGINTEFVDFLIKENLTITDDNILSGDQTMTTIIPYIKYYLPKSKIVPLLLSSFLKEESIDKLSESLERNMDTNIVIIASTDFSHFLPYIKAGENDKVTLNLIKNFEISKILSLDNKFTDSPVSLAVLLKIAMLSGNTGMEVIDYANSGQMQKNSSIESTSYYSAGFFIE